MKRPISGYTKTLDTLAGRFKERHDSQNQAHKVLQTKLNDLAVQLGAVETIRQNRDPLASMDAHALNVGRAAARLKLLGEEAAKAITTKAQEADASFEAALREHSGLKQGFFAAEIRSRLHAMNPGERVRAVQGLIEAKDGSSLAAIFDAPPMLTGIPVEDLQKFRSQFYEAVVPDLVATRDTYKDLTEHVQTAIKTSLAAASEYSNPVKLRELEAREAEAAKAQAALGE